VHWTLDDLKLECVDWHVKSEEVSNRYFSHPYPESSENVDLCPECYSKRTSEEEGDVTETS
jgi:hypothetical protein